MKRVLIVCAGFPPSTPIGWRRPFRLARKLPEQGWCPFVLTTAPRCGGPVTADPSRKPPPDLDIRRIPCWSLWNHSRWWRESPPGVRRLLAGLRAGTAKLTRPLVPVDDCYPWALIAASPGVSMVRELGIDLIWSTVPPLSSAYLGRQIARRTGVPHVVDFRDVAGSMEAGSGTRRQRSWFQAEREILSSSAAVSCTSPPQIAVLAKRYPWVMDKPLQLIYNWFDGDEITPCKARHFDSPKIVHGGSLYGGRRRLDKFIEALALLRDEAPSPGARIQLLQFSDNAQDQRYVSELQSRPGFEQLIEFRPSLPRLEFLSTCLGAAVLLLAVGHDSSGVSIHEGAIPAKLYDYFAAARPILVVGPEGCEAGRLVRELNRGMAVANDRPDDIANAIRRLMAGQGHARQLDLSAEGVREFESATVMRKVAAFLDSVTPA